MSALAPANTPTMIMPRLPPEQLAEVSAQDIMLLSEKSEKRFIEVG